MKKTHFGMIVMSGLLVANVALAQDNPAPQAASQAAPAALPAAPASSGSMPAASVSTDQAWSAPAVEPEKFAPSDIRPSDTKHIVTYDAFIAPNAQIGGPNAVSLKTGGQAQLITHLPDFRDAGVEYGSGRRIVVTARASVDANGHTSDTSSGHVVNGGSMLLEASGLGEYTNDGPEIANAWVARAMWERNPGTGQTGASTLAIGHEWSQGNNSAPTGTNTAMPIQKGFSIRKDVLVEAGKGRVDGIQSGSSPILNGVAQGAVQHCFSLKNEMEKALCLSAGGTLKLGTQAEVDLNARAIFAADLGGKQYGYAGLQADTTLGTNLVGGGQNNALTTGFVAGVAF